MSVGAQWSQSCPSFCPRPCVAATAVVYVGGEGEGLTGACCGRVGCTEVHTQKQTHRWHYYLEQAVIRSVGIRRVKVCILLSLSRLPGSSFLLSCWVCFWSVSFSFSLKNTTFFCRSTRNKLPHCLFSWEGPFLLHSWRLISQSTGFQHGGFPLQTRDISVYSRLTWLLRRCWCKSYLCSSVDHVFVFLDFSLDFFFTCDSVIWEGRAKLWGFGLCFAWCSLGFMELWLDAWR